MSGAANFPGSLDTDGSLYDVTDSVSTLQAAHHNNIKEAVKAIEAKLGINVTAVPTSVDYRLGNPTGAHDHGGASGMGPQINPTVIPAPSGAVGAPAYLYDHLMATAIHRNDLLLVWQYQGSLPNGASLGSPLKIPKTMQFISVDSNLRRAPSGATTALDINVGPTSLWTASQGLRPIFNAGVLSYQNASPNLVTYPSGALLVVDVDAVGSNDPGQDLSITFVFRE